MSQYAFPGTSPSHRPHPTGFAGYNYYMDAKARHATAMIEEEKRMARNQQLMDAYGSKESLSDMQQALDAYHAR
ncbi:hypothetical protein N7539_004846 [Penicillium diatomitis]|uniref:Uncharacterized protein n=1 Tax=Penicillium diatomitis TaxID=2819901 RepID=A0A9X0BU74_9EURO|nr:uncharacterized protein N7539_004846 [Penicillium diatomitis]KAJ5484858.1 hypothetical protein N7539_004846 [Penicillium diatomitis]